MSNFHTAFQAMITLLILMMETFEFIFKESKIDELDLTRGKTQFDVGRDFL